MLGGTFGTQELVIILILVLVLFGAKRIPEIMRGFGQGLREFKDASQRAMDEIDHATSVDPPKPEPPETAPMPEESPKIEPE